MERATMIDYLVDLSIRTAFRVFLFALAVVLAVAAGKLCDAQVTYADAPGSVNVAFTITPTGTGTGSLNSLDGLINNCHVGGGSCTGVYPLGSSITVTPTATGGSNFNWVGGTDGASVCSGTGACTFIITATASISGVFSAAGSAVLASPFFSVDLNSSTKFPATDCTGGVGICPNMTLGQGRLWDTPQVLWPMVETANNVFSWSGLDGLLSTMNANSVHSAQMALARTPKFATDGGGYTDAGSCSYIAYSSTGTVTALSESGSTVTATSTFNPGVNNWIVMNGDTPKGYDGVFQVTSSSVTQFQYTAVNTGLGAGTAFGTVGITQNQTFSVAGQCDPPTDLNRDGTGTGLFFRNWVGALSNHVTVSNYTNTHAHILDYECWNEPDTNQFFSASFGTYDQLARMCQDAYYIIKGDANFIFALTSVNSSGVYTGTVTNGASNYYVGQHFNVTGFTNGGNNLTNAVVTASSATSLTFAASTTTETHAATARMVNRFTGETAAQVRAAVTSVASCCDGAGNPADTTANVVMPSYHGSSPAIGYSQCYLYCTGTCTNPGGSNSCHVGANIYTDAINFHMKPGQNLEGQMSTWVTAIDALLVAQDLAKPLYNTEGGFSAAGWTSPYSADSNLQASFIAQFYPYSYSLGVLNNVWYDWTTNSNAGLGNSTVGSVGAQTAWNQIYTWMVGSTMGTLTTSSPQGSSCPAGETCFTYTYTMTLPNSVAAAIIWDTSQTCTPCTTANQTVNSSYLSYLTTLGGITKTSIVSHQVPVGIQPILVQAQ
jgi:hypothetical protein